MASPTPDRYDLRTMRDAYDAWKDSHYLVGVDAQFGGRISAELAATPRVRWEPTTDRYELVGRATFADQPRGPGGTNKLSSVRSKHVRQAGVSLFIYGKDDSQTEDTIARVVLALEDCFGAEKNCAFVGGAWNLARAQSTNSERYSLHIVIPIPIIRILPAANVADEVLTTIPEVQ